MRVESIAKGADGRHVGAQGFGGHVVRTPAGPDRFP